MPRSAHESGIETRERSENLMQKYCLFGSGEGGTGGDIRGIIAYLVKIQDKDKASKLSSTFFLFYLGQCDRPALGMELSQASFLIVG
jgi:hypothetical protein